MLVSGYARYGTYDVSKVSTYNDSYNDTVSDMTGTAGTLQADKELEANESQQDTVLDKYKFFVDSPNLGTDKDGTVRIVRR